MVREHHKTYTSLEKHQRSRHRVQEGSFTQSKLERSLYTNNKVGERFRGGWGIKVRVKLGAKEIDILFLFK
jgi:hypothetical protein